MDLQKAIYMLVGGLLVVLGNLIPNIVNKDAVAQTKRYTTSRSSVSVYEYYHSKSGKTGFLLNKVTGTLQKADNSVELTTYGMTDGFLDGEQIEVARLCAEAAARGARVIVSNNYSESIRKEYWRAAKKAGARISKSRKDGRFQRRVRLKRTMQTVVGREREQVEEILVFMGPKN